MIMQGEGHEAAAAALLSHFVALLSHRTQTAFEGRALVAAAILASAVETDGA